MTCTLQRSVRAAGHCTPEPSQAEGEMQSRSCLGCTPQWPLRPHERRRREPERRSRSPRREGFGMGEEQVAQPGVLLPIHGRAHAAGWATGRARPSRVDEDGRYVLVGGYRESSLTEEVLTEPRKRGWLGDTDRNDMFDHDLGEALAVGQDDALREVAQSGVALPMRPSGSICAPPALRTRFLHLRCRSAPPAEPETGPPKSPNVHIQTLRD